MPEELRRVIGRLEWHFNILRIKVYRHVIALEQAGKATANEFRFVICSTQRSWVDDEHRRVCLAGSIADIFPIISVKRHLNWQNYTLLAEIVSEYGDAGLKGELGAYCWEVHQFESTAALADVKNIIFTPLGPDQGLMRVPIPSWFQNQTMGLMRQIQNGFQKNGYTTSPHHVGQNSPLAIFFIVPQLLLTPSSMAKLKATNSEKTEDRVVYTLSEDEVLELLDVS